MGFEFSALVFNRQGEQSGSRDENVGTKYDYVRQHC